MQSTQVCTLAARESRRLHANHANPHASHASMHASHASMHVSHAGMHASHAGMHANHANHAACTQVTGKSQIYVVHQPFMQFAWLPVSACISLAVVHLTLQFHAMAGSVHFTKPCYPYCWSVSQFANNQPE